MTEEKGLLAALEDFCMSAECAAGCDEGVSEDVAYSEVLSFGGSALASSYMKAQHAIAAYKARPVAPASAVEALREAVSLAIADASYHLAKYRPHVLEALTAALTAQAHPAGDDALRGAMDRAIEKAKADGASSEDIATHWLAYNYLEAALATHPQPDEAQAQSSEGAAVAWMYERNGTGAIFDRRKPDYTSPVMGFTETPLYAHPAPASDRKVVK